MNLLNLLSLLAVALLAGAAFRLPEADSDRAPLEPSG